MAITYPYAMPSSPAPRSVTPRPIAAVGISASGFTFQQQVQRHQGQQWVFEIELPPMERADAEQWISWRLALNGMEGTFLFGDPAAKTPRGIATGSPLANSAGSPSVNLARETELVTDGWTPGVTGILKAGDYCQVLNGSRYWLHKNLTDVNSDGSGNAVLNLWPYLRQDIVDNAVITVNSPKGLFRMASNEMGWDVGEAKIYGLSFIAIEALGNE
jgi:hypothetical protein